MIVQKLMTWRIYYMIAGGCWALKLPISAGFHLKYEEECCLSSRISYWFLCSVFFFNASFKLENALYGYLKLVDNWPTIISSTHIKHSLWILPKPKIFFFFFFYLLDSIYIFIFHHWWLLSKKKNSNLWRGRQVLKQWPMYFSVSSCGTYFSWLHISSNARKQCTPIEMNFRHF